jgi:DNA-binding response OmpR family regulator
MAQRVLVVDDSPTIRKVVAGVLSRAGYEVGHAGDGAQALAVLKREKFNLALVDFVMPKVNGFELCKKLREDAELRDLPVVLMSAKADKIREHFLRQTGALDAITKPFDPRALLLMIEGALQKVEEGKRRRTESVPPTSQDGAESTLTDTFGGPPASMRAAVPEAFLRRIGEAIARSAQFVKGSEPPSARDGVAALRHAVGEDGLAGLYSELAGSTANAVLSGDLSAIPLAEILQLLQLQRQTGILTVFDSKTEVQIAMREGLVDLATSRGASDEFRLGRYVIELGALDRQSLDDFIKRERASGKSRLLGDALVAEGILTRDNIGKALERQTSELIYDVLRWTRGRFVFDHGATRSEASAAQLGLPVASIVMEGFRRVDEWRLMEGALGDFEQVFYRDPGAIEAMGTSRLTREERAVLMAVDGERTVREVIGAVSMGSFDVCKILYQFVQSRLVRRRDTR